jgi:hypothetical protein
MPEALAGDPTPVETPVAAPEATPQPETTAVPEAESKPVETQKTFTQEELDRIVEKRLARERRGLQPLAEARAEAAYYRRLAEQAQQPTAKAQPSDGRPREEDFVGKPYSAYVEALTEWKAANLLDQRLKAREQETQAQASQRQAAEQAQWVKERLSQGAEEFPDFEEVALADHVPITQAMAAAIAESDMPARVAYYLGSHLEEAKRIAGLTPTKQVREIAKIEASLSEPPPTSKAPPPIKPSTPKASGEIDPDKLSAEEWRKWREAQLRRKRS